MKILKYLSIAIIIIFPFYFIFVQLSDNVSVQLFDEDEITEAEKNSSGENNEVRKDEMEKDLLKEEEEEEVLSDEELLELEQLLQDDQALLEQEVQEYLEEQRKEEELNEPLKLNVRDLIADASEYESRRVIVGPLIITGNNLERKSLRTYALTESGRTDYDASLEVFYIDMPDSDTKWRHLYIDVWDRHYIDSVEGTFRLYRDSENKGYIKAEKIILSN